MRVGWPSRAVVKLHALTAAADAAETIAENRFALPGRLQKIGGGSLSADSLIFFVVEGDRVIVIACFHGKHGPTIQAAEIAEELRSIGVTCKLKAETWGKVAS